MCQYYGLTDNGIFLQKLIIRGLQKLRFEEIVIIVFLLLMSLIRLIAGFSLLPKESLMYLLLVFTILFEIFTLSLFSISPFVDRWWSQKVIGIKMFPKYKDVS